MPEYIIAFGSQICIRFHAKHISKSDYLRCHHIKHPSYYARFRIGTEKHKKSPKTKSASDVICIENGAPAIVSTEVFEKAQARMAS
ncbi:MAG: recombinase family protein, partial [Ethanoligenens sp.]